MNKQTLILMLVLAALLILPIAAHAQATDPVAVVSGFLTDIDDPSKSITYLADDVHIQIIPPPPGINGSWDGKAWGTSICPVLERPRYQGRNAWRLEGEWGYSD